MATVLLGGAVAALALYRWRPVPVLVSEVVRGTAVEAVYANGTVEAVDRATVKAKVAGAIMDLRVAEGARVKRGDLLAVIEARPLEAELARAEAESRAAARQASAGAPQLAVLEAQARALEADLGIARDDRDRTRRLAESGAATPVEEDRARSRVAVLEAQLAANRSQREALRIELVARASGSSAAVRSVAARVADAELRAPLDGVVLSREVEPGEVVAVNQPILRVGDVDHLILECSVDEADVARVAAGDQAAIALYAFPGQVFRGRVTEVMPDADRLKKSFLVKVAFDAPPRGLRSGMSAEVNVVVQKHPGVLLAPVEAIDAAGTAWVIADGRAERRPVRTGVRDLAHVELLSGAARGEQLVVSGAERLTDGARVRVSARPFLLQGAAPAQGEP